MSREAPAAQQGPQRFIDQGEAAAEVERWIERVAAGLPKDADNRIERFGLRLAHESARPNGGVTVIWSDNHQVGLATVVRDHMNWSVLTIFETDARGRALPERVARRSDMDPSQALVVTPEEDGDILVGIGEAPRFLALDAVQFCTAVGGGQSPRTLAALRHLAWAMQQDSLERPQGAIAEGRTP